MSEIEIIMCCSAGFITKGILFHIYIVSIRAEMDIYTISVLYKMRGIFAQLGVNEQISRETRE